MLVWRERRRGALVSAVALVVMAGCTASPAPAQTPSSTEAPSSLPPTSTATPTATQTWSADQTDAIAAVGKFAAADDRIGADPSAFTEKQMTELLKQFSGGEALRSTVAWHLLLKKHGYRLAGEMSLLSTLATKAVNGDRGVEVHVSQCQDQRQGKVVDRSGSPVSGAGFQIPEYNLRQYSVRKPPGGGSFRVFGFETINGKCP